MSVTICDVGPRDGLQNEEKHLDPETRAELVNRLAAAGLPRIEAVSFVNPARVPQMAGAEEVVAAIDRRDGVVYAGLVLNERGYDRLRGDRASTRCTSPSPRPRRSTGATRTPRVEESLEAAERDRRARARGRHPRDGDDRRRRSAARSRAPSTRRGCSASPRSSRRRAPTRSSSPTRSASACRARCKQLVGEAVEARRRRSACTCTTRATPASRTRTRRSRRGRRCSTRRSAGIGGCPFAPRATGNICTEDLVYLLHGEGDRDGDRPRRADRGRRVARRRARAAAPGQVYRAGTFAPVAG